MSIETMIHNCTEIEIGQPIEIKRSSGDPFYTRDIRFKNSNGECLIVKAFMDDGGKVILE